jgi:hypothetical protein
LTAPNFLIPAAWPPFAGRPYKNRYDGTKTNFVAILQLNVSDKEAIDVCPVRWIQILQPIGIADSKKNGMLRWYRRMINDYVVRWSTANHDKVADQLMRCEINAFAIQNQASHIIFKQSLPFRFRLKEWDPTVGGPGAT